MTLHSTTEPQAGNGNPVRHRRSPSSERFLGLFSSSPTSSSAAAAEELSEDDIFFVGVIADPKPPSLTSKAASLRKPSFGHPTNSGILAALSDSDIHPKPLLWRKPSLPSTTSSQSKPIPSIPRPLPEREYSQSAPARKFQQSAPMNVPLLSIAMARQRNKKFLEEDDDVEDEEMLPPHEIVARGSGRDPKTTSSVLEGVGRTLKGRDLRQVRNAVWRQTGFLD